MVKVEYFYKQESFNPEDNLRDIDRFGFSNRIKYLLPCKLSYEIPNHAVSLNLTPVFASDGLLFSKKFLKGDLYFKKTNGEREAMKWNPSFPNIFRRKKVLVQNIISKTKFEDIAIYSLQRNEDILLTNTNHFIYLIKEKILNSPRNHLEESVLDDLLFPVFEESKRFAEILNRKDFKDRIRFSRESYTPAFFVEP